MRHYHTEFAGAGGILGGYANFPYLTYKEIKNEKISTSIPYPPIKNGYNFLSGRYRVEVKK